jgi:hypothetical protein
MLSKTGVGVGVGIGGRGPGGIGVLVGVAVAVAVGVGVGSGSEAGPHISLTPSHAHLNEPLQNGPRGLGSPNTWHAFPPKFSGWHPIILSVLFGKKA